MALLARRLRPNELELLNALKLTSEASAFLPEDRKGEGDDWGLWLDERLIGWCRLVGRPPVLWVSRILIDADYMGLGYGKVLLQKVLEEIRRLRRWREVRAAVHPDNVRALRLFEGLGFEALSYEEAVGEIILKRSLQ